MSLPEVIEPVNILRRKGFVTSTFGASISSFTLKNDKDEPERAEIILDYAACEGGMPLFDVACSTSASSVPINVEVVYSESADGIDHENGMLRLKTAHSNKLTVMQEMALSSCSRMQWIHTEGQPCPCQ